MPTNASVSVAPNATWQDRLADWLVRLADTIKPVERRHGVGGQMLDFKMSLSLKLGKPVYIIYSKRGGFTMGRIEWSNQWRKPCYRPDTEAPLDKQCVAEIHAMLRDYR